MAENIQGQLTILHKVEQSTPTQMPSYTSPKIGDEAVFSMGALEDVKTDDMGTKGAKKVMGKTSIRRRLSNMAISGVERVVNRQFDNAIFRESLTGDKRGMKKIQNTKVLFNGLTKRTLNN